MTDFLGGLIAVIIEALLKVFTSKFFVKAILATMTYVFLFAVIPALITYLVPQTVMNATDTYVQMLQSGADSLICQGSAHPVSGQSITCDQAISMTQWGQGIAYVLSWFQFKAALGIFLPVLSVRFLFKRI
jgi:predicted PurR-regulated permease PerM